MSGPFRQGSGVFAVIIRKQPTHIPHRQRGRREYRLHLQLTSPRRSADKLKYLAGSESAMGAYIADVLPEQTARRLREVFLLP